LIGLTTLVAASAGVYFLVKRFLLIYLHIHPLHPVLITNCAVIFHLADQWDHMFEIFWIPQKQLTCKVHPELTATPFETRP